VEILGDSRRLSTIYKKRGRRKGRKRRRTGAIDSCGSLRISSNFGIGGWIKMLGSGFLGREGSGGSHKEGVGGGGRRRGGKGR